ncbi:TlpA family protein disulfide reductase [Alicyclobacillus fodiniaquatilis]|uniref:TlpA family protein disulfide reductase n=1 Tax=Alicyclobacillus fodiniaquatilis TaxID=1661150 RepID=A0ABW4JGM6_9BACL
MNAHAARVLHSGRMIVRGGPKLSTLLQPVRAKLQSELWQARLHNASGHMTTLPTDRPVLIVASWCAFCHQTLQLLSQHDLLNKVQVVVALDDGSEVGGKPANVKTVKDEETIFEREMRELHVTLPTNELLYSLPTDSFDHDVSAVPLLLVHRDGKWQELKGYVPDADVWRQALDGTSQVR